MPMLLQTAALVIAGCALLACAGGTPAGPESPGGSASGQSQGRTPEGLAFRVAAGEPFSVVLPSSGGGGYQWHLVEDYDGRVVSLAGRRTGALPKGAPLGKFADEIFDFTGAAPGATTLTFSLYRSWEGPERAVETRRHAVTVR